MWHFEELDVSNIPPFGDAGRLELHEKLNCIVGENGAGKTTLFRAFRGDLQPSARRVAGDDAGQSPPCVTYWDESVTDGPLTRLPVEMRASLLQLNDPTVFAKATLAGIRRLLRGKVRQRHGSNKASWLDELNVKVSREGDLSLLVEGQKISAAGAFAPAGEKTVLSLALMGGLRESIPALRRVPWVLDEPFGMLNRELRNSVETFLLEAKGQVVLIMSPLHLEGSRIRPTHRIDRDTQAGASRISKLPPSRTAQ